MGDESSAQRVNDALSTLVQRFLPSPNDDGIVSEQRHQGALDLAKNIIERSFLPNMPLVFSC